jgi:nucleoside-diphosphate-sugar epimerase
MAILVVGASGYIGSAVSAALRATGHDVTGYVRSEQSKTKVEARGEKAIVADLRDREAMLAAVAKSDGVIVAAQAVEADAGEAAATAVRAITDALRGTGKPFIYTGGSWEYGNTGATIADENTPHHPPAIVAWRSGVGQMVQRAAREGIRSIVIRPGMVYGNGGGLISMFIDWARQRGTAVYIGKGESRLPWLQIEDLALLYLLALEKAPGGSAYNAAEDRAYTRLETAPAIAQAAGVRETAEWPLQEARAALGPFADALALDQQVTSAKARNELGWKTRNANLLEDIAQGSYATSART